MSPLILSFRRNAAQGHATRTIARLLVPSVHIYSSGFMPLLPCPPLLLWLSRPVPFSRPFGQ
jgi:hypothetical protein